MTGPYHARMPGSDLPRIPGLSRIWRSGSGTFVNGQRVDAVRLNPGDQIRIGTSTFTFSTGVK